MALGPPPKGKSHVNFISFQSLNYKCIDHQLISSARLQNYLLVVTANVPKAMMAPDRTTSWCNDVFKPDLAQFLATTRQTHWLAENTSAFLVEGVFMLSNFKNSCKCGGINWPSTQQSHMWKNVAREVDISSMQCDGHTDQTSSWCIN